MKRLISTVLAIILALALTGSALADVINIPEDDFYDKHADACRLVEREYYANGAAGYATVLVSPESKDTVGFIPNTNVLTVDVTYTGASAVFGLVAYSVNSDGSFCMSGEGGDDLVKGWVNMSEMTLKYDNQSFSEEFGGSFTQDEKYENALAGYSVKNAIYFYSYPGSGEVQDTLTAIDPEYSLLTFSDIYKDESGHMWGYCGYYMQRSGWVYLDDPENAELPRTLDRTPQLVPGSDIPAKAGSGVNMTLIAVILIAVAVITVAVVIYISKKKKKETQ